MAAPTNTPNNPDPNLRERGTVDPTGRPVRTGGGRPWAWIVGIIVILLIIWAFFGWNDRSRTVTPAAAPAAATTTVR